MTMCVSGDESTAETTAPLNIVAEHKRYPNLHGVYVMLSGREQAMYDLGSDGELAEDENTLCTKISGTDFETPLVVPEKSPFPVESDINKFLSFVWNMFDACETGSILGDACRLERVLLAAVEDVKSMKDPQKRIEHLLGLTIAIFNQGLDAFFDRGDVESGTKVFQTMAELWKKFFDRDPSCESITALPEDVRKLSLSYCSAMKKMLKSTRKTYGDHAATYTFNYIRIPRKRGGSSSSSQTDETSIQPSVTKKTKTKKPTTESN